jgi:hypothetical protein
MGLEYELASEPLHDYVKQLFFKWHIHPAMSYRGASLIKNCARDGRCSGTSARPTERDFFTDNVPVQIHSIIEITLVNRPCAMGF